jgi:hypothetical protein
MSDVNKKVVLAAIINWSFCLYATIGNGFDLMSTISKDLKIWVFYLFLMVDACLLILGASVFFCAKDFAYKKTIDYGYIGGSLTLFVAWVAVNNHWISLSQGGLINISVLFMAFMGIGFQQGYFYCQKHINQKNIKNAGAV